eukprot:756574-Hanusia_phi.AAC.1
MKESGRSNGGGGGLEHCDPGVRAHCHGVLEPSPHPFAPTVVGYGAVHGVDSKKHMRAHTSIVKDQDRVNEAGPSVYPLGIKSKEMRATVILLGMCLFLPVLMIGRSAGKELLSINWKGIFPPHKWSWTQWSAENKRQVTVSSVANHMKMVARGTTLQAKTKKPTEGGTLHSSSNKLSAVENTQSSSGKSTSGQDETLKNGEGHHSIWAFGPFVFSVGIVLSILIKLVCSLPLSKFASEMLFELANVPEEEGDLESAALLDEDEGRGRSSDRTSRSSHSSVKQTGQRADSARESFTPSVASSGGLSTGSAKKDGKKWPCSLDLPA